LPYLSREATFNNIRTWGKEGTVGGEWGRSYSDTNEHSDFDTLITRIQALFFSFFFVFLFFWPLVQMAANHR